MNKEEVLYQIVAVDSELKKGFPDKITTILKNGSTGKTYTDYDFRNHRYLYCFINDNFNIYDRFEEKDKEIQRLNDIIKNLDKMFEYYFLGNLKYDQDTVNAIYIKYVKLKERKESK